ncbi:hypothetical protein GOV06_02755 [Candidatus Woesearchaeota archaeon]|nr:hypothetical protein [Candidatus Woesearchaeota archaeon]
MTEEKPKPQLIVLKDGVFRLAELDRFYFAKTLDDKIEPDELTMVSSAYLGPRNYIVSMPSKRIREEYGSGEIFRSSMRMAEELGVPYFSVNFVEQEVRPPVDLDARTEDSDIMGNIKPDVIDDYIFNNLWEKSKKVEYSMHATAQFYVSRTKVGDEE